MTTGGVADDADTGLDAVARPGAGGGIGSGIDADGGVDPDVRMDDGRSGADIGVDFDVRMDDRANAPTDGDAATIADILAPLGRLDEIDVVDHAGIYVAIHDRLSAELSRGSERELSRGSERELSRGSEWDPAPAQHRARAHGTP